MELEYKADTEEAKQRIEAWWRGEKTDRVPVKVTAPLKPARSPEPSDQELEKWWTDPEWVIPRLEAQVAATYWAGEAVPLVHAVPNGMVAVLAAYLGCPYHLQGKRTAWAEPIIEDWDNPPPLQFDPQNRWWRLSADLLKAAAERAPGRYYVALPDLNGPGEILARLRGTEPLLLDLCDSPAPLRPALDKINLAWHRYYQACTSVVNQHVEGSLFWMGIWSGSPATDLQCDFSCMISPAMFDDLFLPALRQQTEWVGRTIYHLDGPDAVRHLDSLLSLPLLNGIEWVPGAGAPPASEWLDLLRKILQSGRLVYVACGQDEVEYLLGELPHKGLLLSTQCRNRTEADRLLQDVARWSA